MRMRKCGGSGVEVSVYCVGAWSFGGDSGDYWGSQEQSEVEKIVHGALDGGVNFFDSAEGYNNGRSEESLGKALGKRRADAVIGTKIAPENCSVEGIRAHCEASLKRLGTDYIDIYMVHWPIRKHPAAEAFQTLDTLRREGKIRAVGVSNFAVQDLTELLAFGVRIDVNQLHYSLLARAIEQKIVPMCIEKNIGVTTYMPLLQGILTGKWDCVEDIPMLRRRTRHFHHSRGGRHGEEGAEPETMKALADLRAIARREGRTMSELALAWAAGKPGITAVIAGARNVEQLRANAEACNIALGAPLIAELDAVTQPVLDKLGGNPDYWESEANSRMR